MDSTYFFKFFSECPSVPTISCQEHSIFRRSILLVYKGTNKMIMDSIRSCILVVFYFHVKTDPRRKCKD